MNAEGRFRCFACGRFTDEVTEEGPTADEAGQVQRVSTGVLDVHENGPCRAAVACWPCFWKTDPDQWITPADWQALSPIIPFDRLPLLDHNHPRAWDPATYPWPKE
jgi:hypothetical protein